MRTRSGQQAAFRSGPGSLSSPVGPSPPVRCVNAYWAGTEIVVLARDDQGQLSRSTVPAEHVSFLRKEDVSRDFLRQIQSSRYVRGVREEGEWLRVRWWTRGDCLRAASREGWFAAHGIKVYEADVDPVRRWMIDSRVQLQTPRRVYLDLETDSRVPFTRKEEARILCWSLVSADGGYRKVLVLEEDTDAAERALIVELWKELTQFDQVVAWSGDFFDFPVIEARTEKRGLSVEMRRWLWLDHLPIFRRLNAHAAESGDEKQSMALGKVAAAVLGPDVKKLIDLRAMGTTTWGLWAAGGEDRQRLAEYNLDDSDLERRIEDATGYLGLHQMICDLTSTLPDTRGGNPTRFVEGYLMRLGVERSIRFPTWHAPQEPGEGEEAAQQFRGAYVMEPSQLGIVRGVHVADFARLYPSIIMSWNMGIETHRPDVRLVESADARPSYLRHLPLKRYPLPEGHCVSADNVVFANEGRSILALALEEVLRLRAFWDDKKKAEPPGMPAWVDADRRSQALKIIANSFYGVIGSVWSRFYVAEVAEAVTQTGVWLIRQTIKAGAARGYKTIYCDTDSLFVVGCTRGAFAEFVAWCNAELYPRLLAEKGVPPERARISIAYEKAFERLVMLGKKRYAGRYEHYKGKDAAVDSKPEVKGLEFKRGDVVRLARSFQSEAINALLAGGEDSTPFEELVARYRQQVLEGELALSDIVLAKGLSKSLREYRRKPKKDGGESALPPHVEVAQVLAERGREIRQGVRIEFFVSDGSSSPAKYAPAEDWTGECDRFYVWEQQVFPPTQRVLETVFPAAQWKRFERARPPKAKGVDKATGLLFAPERQLARGVAERSDGNPGSHGLPRPSPKPAPSRQGKLF
jgi:DNA polymerase elongation subunit (family B)